MAGFYHFFLFFIFWFFLSKDLAVRTACLTLPLACGYFDELVVCTKPYLVANSRKESMLYWGPTVRYYKIWNAVNGEEFLECLNDNLIAEFLDFKPSGVIVCDNEVDFPVQHKRNSGNPFPWTRRK